MAFQLGRIEPSPDVFAAVMATGILSIAANKHHYPSVSETLGVLAMTWLIVWRAVTERNDRDGFEPDSWILMGGLAIATLAGDNLHGLASGWLAQTVRVVTLVTWVVASGWIPPLIYFGLRRINRRPGMLQFAGVWWAMVFPLGMYSAATAATAAELRRPALNTISLVLFWVALTTWSMVAVAGLLRLRRALAQRD